MIGSKKVEKSKGKDKKYKKEQPDGLIKAKPLLAVETERSQPREGGKDRNRAT